MNPYALPNFACALACFGIGWFVLNKNQRSPVNIAFSLLALSTFIWQLGTFFLLISAASETAYRWSQFVYVGAIFIPVTTYHFVVAFLKEPKSRKGILIGYLIGALVFLPISQSRYFLNGVNQYPWGYWFKAGVLHPSYLIFFGALMFMSFKLLYRGFRREMSPGERTRRRYLFVAFVIAYLGAVDFPSDYGIPLYPFGYLAVLLFIGLVAYAIVRHRLLDINIAIARVTIFTLAYVPLLLLPIIVGSVFQPQLTMWLGKRWWIAPSALEALVAVVGLSIYKMMTRRAEDRLLAEQRKYQQLLVMAAEGMLKILDLKKLLRRIVGIMVKYVRLQYAAVYLQEDPVGPFRLQARWGDAVELPETFDADDALIHYLAASEGPVVTEELKRSMQEGGTRKLIRMSERLVRMKASVVIPASLKESHMLGFLVLGPKLSGQMFTSDDLRTFNALAHQAAIAIQNAHFHRRGVNLGQMATGHEQLAAWGHEMGNVLHIGVIQVGVLKARLQDSPEMPSREKLIEQLDHIEAALLRGRGVIDDLKAYLRCAEQPGAHAYPLAQFLEDAVKKLQKRFEDCPNIKIVLNLPDNLPTVEGLATLSLLPLNLLAIPFWGLSAQPSGGAITVKALTDAQRSHVELSVTDDAADSLRKFVENPTRPGEESFFPTRSRHGALYYFMAKKTVSDHGGKLAVLDGAGGEKGTMILVRLPVKYTPPKPEEEEESLGDAA